MTLASITRFPGGLNNQSETSGLADLRANYPQIYNLMQDDFNTYTAAQWTVAGTAAGVPAFVADTDGGVVGAPTTATNPSETSMSTLNKTFLPVRSKDFFVVARLRLSVADAGMFFGLSGGGAASPVGTLPADGIFIRKLWTLPPAAVLRVSGVTAATAPLSPMVNDTWHEFVIAYTAADGALRAFMDGAGTRLATNPAAFPAVALGLAFSVRTEAASIRNLLIDNYFVAKAR